MPDGGPALEASWSQPYFEKSDCHFEAGRDRRLGHESSNRRRDGHECPSYFEKPLALGAPQKRGVGQFDLIFEFVIFGDDFRRGQRIRQAERRVMASTTAQYGNDLNVLVVRSFVSVDQWKLPAVEYSLS